MSTEIDDNTQTYELLANLRRVRRYMPLPGMQDVSEVVEVLQQARKVMTWSPHVRAEGAVCTKVEIKWFDVPLEDEGDGLLATLVPPAP